MFHYGSSRDSVAAIRYGRSDHRVVFVAFGLEGIADTAKRASVLERSITWLLSDAVTSVTPSDPARLTLPSIAPNPTHGPVVVTTGVRADATIVVTSLLGERVRTVHVAPGTPRTAVDLGDLAKGIYLVSVESDGERTTQPIVVE